MSGFLFAAIIVSTSTNRLLKNPTQCFDRLTMSGSPPLFHCTFPLTLSLSKGAKTFFSNLLSVRIARSGDVADSSVISMPYVCMLAAAV